MNKRDKKSFVVMKDLLDPIKLMTDEEAGKLLRAMVAHWEEEEFELPRELTFAFASIKNQFDRDWKKYQAKCVKNKNNALQRHDNKGNSTSRTQSHPIAADNDTDTDTDTDKDKDTDTDTEGLQSKDIPYQEENVFIDSSEVDKNTGEIISFQEAQENF